MAYSSNRARQYKYYLTFNFQAYQKKEKFSSSFVINLFYFLRNLILNVLHREILKFSKKYDLRLHNTKQVDNNINYYLFVNELFLLNDLMILVLTIIKSIISEKRPFERLK